MLRAVSGSNDKEYHHYRNHFRRVYKLLLTIAAYDDEDKST